MKRKEVLEILQITPPTLCKYVKQGIVKVDNQINGQYIYNDESVYNLKNNTKPIEAKPVELQITEAVDTKPTNLSDVYNAIIDIEAFFEKLLPLFAQLRVLDPAMMNTYNDLKKSVDNIKNIGVNNERN